MAPSSSHTHSIDSFYDVTRSSPPTEEPPVVRPISRQAKAGHACDFCRKRRIRCFREVGNLECQNCIKRSQDCIKTNFIPPEEIKNNSIDEGLVLAPVPHPFTPSFPLARMWLRAKLNYATNDLIRLKVLAEELGLDCLSISLALEEVRNSLFALDQIINYDNLSNQDAKIEGMEVSNQLAPDETYKN